MKESRGLPPNFEQINRKFKLNMATVVFAYGDTLYNPGGGEITPDLWAHEETHQRQQEAMGIDFWWERYLSDPNFRLQQEVEAYQNQYRYAEQHYGRQARRDLLKHLASSMSGATYGNMITYKDAVDIIQGLV